MKAHSQQRTRLLLALILALVLGIWLSHHAAIAELPFQSSPLQPSPTPVVPPTSTPSPTWTPLPLPTATPTFTPVPPPTFTPTPLPSPTPVLPPPPTTAPTVMPTAVPTNPPPPPPPVREDVLGETPPPLLPGYTPIPTYAPPLYIPQPDEGQPGPTEVATPWPTPIRIDRSRLPWRAYFAYIHYDWAYTYPFLRRPVYPTAPAPKPGRAQRLLRVLHSFWRILPSFLCLGLALFLGMIEAILIILSRKRRTRR